MCFAGNMQKRDSSISKNISQICCHSHGNAVVTICDQLNISAAVCKTKNATAIRVNKAKLIWSIYFIYGHLPGKFGLSRPSFSGTGASSLVTFCIIRCLHLETLAFAIAALLRLPNFSNGVGRWQLRQLCAQFSPLQSRSHILPLTA